MSNRIGADHSRFKDIIRKKVRGNLSKYISSGELLGRVGKDVVSVPIPQIDMPRFVYGDKQAGGAGQGDGDVGDPVGGDPDQKGKGKKAGKDTDKHGIEADISMDELADMLGDELQLPKIENKGKENIIQDSNKYTGISRVGPGSLRHMKRSYKETLKRAISSGDYNPDQPVLMPVRDDWRYRAPDITLKPQAQAVVIYMMDVSGSMGDDQKEIVRLESFWIDLWLRRQYKGIETRFITHDAEAREVDRHTFFHTRESGGTRISSALDLCMKIIDKDYPSSSWNIYPFHFSDGDNWSTEDTEDCIKVLRDRLLPVVNVFSYGQVDSPYGSGQFYKDLRTAFPDDDRVTLSQIADRDAILPSIKEFLGKGK
jgi:hypothetical protein